MSPGCSPRGRLLLGVRAARLPGRGSPHYRQPGALATGRHDGCPGRDVGGAPLLNGVLALATQLNHGNLGPVNPLLYRVLGPRWAKAGIADVVHGNDSGWKPAGTWCGWAAC